MSKTVKEVKQFIKNSVKWLKKVDSGCCVLRLDNRLAVCVGWQGGYSEDDAELIHSESAPEYCIVAGLKVWTSDYLQADYDFLAYPYHKSGEVVDVETGVNRRFNNDYLTHLSKWLLSEYYDLTKYEIDKSGKIIAEIENKEAV